MRYKDIKTDGINYLERFPNAYEWLWGTNYSSGDLYEAEEIVQNGYEFEPNRLIFVHYPGGEVYEPLKAAKGQYFGNPRLVDKMIIFMLVDFNDRKIKLFQWNIKMNMLNPVTALSLDKVKDCYNLKLDTYPLMLTRHGQENLFEIIWPEKRVYAVGEREAFLFRDENKLFFASWDEMGDEYHDEIIIRDYEDGKIIERFEGSIRDMPDGSHWILR